VPEAGISRNAKRSKRLSSLALEMISGALLNADAIAAAHANILSAFEMPLDENRSVRLTCTHGQSGQISAEEKNSRGE
jgi:hypothetical protein